VARSKVDEDRPFGFAVLRGRPVEEVADLPASSMPWRGRRGRPRSTI
jgi:hypothetical protein